MKTEAAAGTYRVWGADNIAYGPVDLTTLASWANDERVTPESWVFADPGNRWIKAAELPELTALLKPLPVEAATPGSTEALDLKPGTLRRLKLLATMEDRQLASFVRYLEVIRYQQFSVVVRAGDKGDAIFLILEGELRARVLIEGKETTLTTLTVGDFFGEISLLDHGPRSADVLANCDSVLLKLSTVAFERMLAEAPALASPFLYTLSRSVVGRIRVLANKYQDSIHLSRTADAGRQPPPQRGDDPLVA